MPRPRPLLRGITRALLTFTILSLGILNVPASGTNELVSVNVPNALTGNRGGFESPVSDDGRYVAFQSSAFNLVTNDTNGGLGDVFRYDSQTDTLALVSTNAAGTGSGNGSSFYARMSGDGRYVLFVSFATDLVSTPDTNGVIDLFVRDLQTGTTELVSVNSAGTGGGNQSSASPRISGDGRYVVFNTASNNIVASDPSGFGTDVFVRDLVANTTALVSFNSAGTGPGNNSSQFPAVSFDGRYVAFLSFASNLVAGDTNGLSDIYARDIVANTTTVVSVNSAGTNGGNGASQFSSISADGRYVAFRSDASDLVANDTNGATDVFLRDLQAGPTELVSHNLLDTASGNGLSTAQAISADGHFVAFESAASDLAANDTNGSIRDVFVTQVHPLADLSIVKIESRDPAFVDRVLTYTLTITNDGPDAASNVLVKDFLPAGPGFQSATASQGSCSHSAGTVTCQLGTLADGASATVTIKVKPTQPATLTNTAQVSSDTVDTDPSDNSSTITTQVVIAADLLVTKTASRNPALANQILTYTVKVTNSGGPHVANNVVVTDTLPTGPNFVSAVSTQGTCSHSSGTVTCQIGTLAVNAQATMTIKIKPLVEGTITNTAAAAATEYDPDTTNSSASVQTTVIKSADLSIRKKDAADPVLLGANVTYTLTITNGGPVAATGVTVTDTLPTSMSFVSASTSQGSITSSPPVGSTGTVTASLGGMAVGATATVTITVNATQAGVFTNTASVSGNESDEDTSNNTHKQQTTVVTLLKLTLSNSMVTGGCEHPTGTVFLTGPAPAGGVTVSLSSTNPAASTPASVFIAAGQTKSGPFTVTTSSVTSQQTGSIRATLGAKTVGRALTVTPGSCL